MLDYAYEMEKGGREVVYKIKETREKMGISQSDLADISGVSRAIISRLETENDTVTTTDTLKKIAKALNTTVGKIFCE